MSRLQFGTKIALCLLLAVSFIPVDAQNTTPMPDLIVRGDRLAQQWVVRDEKLDATFCSVEEGGITAGTRRLIRFTVMTPNIGNADIVVGDPNVHVQNNDGLFEFAT